MNKKVNKPPYELKSVHSVWVSFNDNDPVEATGLITAISLTPVPIPPTSGIAFYTGGGEDE